MCFLPFPNIYKFINPLYFYVENPEYSSRMKEKGEEGIGLHVREEEHYGLTIHWDERVYSVERERTRWTTYRGGNALFFSQYSARASHLRLKCSSPEFMVFVRDDDALRSTPRPGPIFVPAAPTMSS